MIFSCATVEEAPPPAAKKPAVQAQIESEAEKKVEVEADPWEAVEVVEKIPVAIIAEKRQIAVYNGSPRRVAARAEPEVPLSFSYYPSAELREKAAQKRDNPDEKREALAGYRRVERAPIEPGVYYVTVFFPGDERHLPASAEVDFMIREAQ
jgi:hypothetical protein